VHDRLEPVGLQVEIADAQKVKGLAPPACKTDRIDAWVLAELAGRDLLPAIWLPDQLVRAERQRARWRLHVVRHRLSLRQRVHAAPLTHGKPRAHVVAPRNVLAARPGRLVDVGVAERRRYSEHPPRDEYLLTDAGRDLTSVLLSLALKQWGDRWCRDGAQTAVFTHTWGAELRAATVCAACGEPIDFADLTITGGTNPPTISGPSAAAAVERNPSSTRR
jgi:DNA-binding HxlR family transcriptional regulator